MSDLLTNEEIEKTLKRSTRLQSIFMNGFFGLVFIVVCTMIYWYFEPDPLNVERIDTDSAWAECNGRQYSFYRLVQSTKDVNIYVQERWHDLDGMMNFNSIEGELVISKPIHYPLGKDFNKVMRFQKQVPKELPIGRYEYRPWATYQVNPIKTITRLLPIQNVNVHCEYSKEKHGITE